MNKYLKRAVCIVLAAVIAATAVAGCAQNVQSDGDDFIIFTSYKDVPEITEQEIQAIEALQREVDYFTYGMPLSTEAFVNENGEIRGYSALFCEWLTELFGITFKPQLYEWLDLLDGLETGEVAFTGDLIATEDRKDIFHMTGAIATRHVKAYRLKDSEPFGEITAKRPLRCGFMEGTATIDRVTEAMEPGTFEIVTLGDFESVHGALISGEIDAYFYSEVAEVHFDRYEDIVVLDFYPLIYVSLSMATQTDLFEPIISVVDKVLQNGGKRYLVDLYNTGYKEFLKHKLQNQLTDEEREHIRTRTLPIPVAAIYSNYPICFYNRRYNEWQGIFFDLLIEIEALTGLTFELQNDENTEWAQMQEMLRDGEVAFVADLIWTKAREEYFIWPETSIQTDYYALISRADYRNITTNEILHTKVGLTRGTAYTAMFLQWFPGHENTVEYDGIEESFIALLNGEVDMVMTTERRLMFLTHYQEQTGYKLNYVFDQSIDTRFGFNQNEVILCSIIDKALKSIDTNGIANQWMRRTYDYRAQIAEAQQPLFIGVLVLFGCVLTLLIVLFFRSRNAGKRLEKLVGVRTQELELASKAKTEFLAKMSHEIRTPMNSVIGFSELALGEDIPQRAKDYLANILQNSEWLLQIINDILDISKIESGKLELEKIPFNLHELFSDCRTMILPKADSKGLLLHFYAEPSIGRVPLGDPTRLFQVLVNLLSNSIKFTSTGLIKVQSAVRKFTENSVTMLFEVKDTGIGMTQEQIENIFEMFTQAETGTTRKYGGTGLGLAITKNLIEMMGGELTVLSTPGVGSKFSFEITFETIDANDKIVLEHKKAPIHMDKPSFKGEILLCEDNSMNQQVITEHLARVGLKTCVAENGQIGVNLVKERIEKNEKQFDLIFMDIHMPVMDGLEAAGKILELNIDVPVVAMTANIMTNDQVVYEMSGMSDYIGKPFTSQELWHCLLKYFEPVEWQAEDKTKKTEADSELQQKLINNFVKSNKNKYNEITDAISSGDIKLAHRLAHTLASNAGQLGKTLLQQAAEVIEYHLKDEKNLVESEHMTVFGKELNKVIKELEPRVSVSAKENEDVQKLSKEEADKLLDELIPYLQEGDTECFTFTDKLRQIPDTAMLIEKMEEFDFKAALEIVSKLKGLN
ncbi:MAG: transporter substrate-binding domain-containing protein [Oscillospiraceae bacterium]|nr:transporter substrate-binding domain-containing protein [Oscillospiraceae bacterium]